MIQSILRYIYGSKNEQFIRKSQPLIDKINGLEQELEQKSDSDLQQQTSILKQRIKNGETLDSILPEAFALVREASKRTIGQRHYDVQLLGGIAIHQGYISEMATGEGKTLSATLPSYLNALSGKGVHVVTVNSYLAKRDAQWMGKIHTFLGLTVGTILPDMPLEQRKQSYNCDITYANNNELGFDFLRDNMAGEHSQQTQRPLNYAIVDEVDSILIDEARTPLIISGPIGESSHMYTKIYPLVEKLSDQGQSPDVEINIKEKQVQLTENGHVNIENMLQENKILTKNCNLYSDENALILHFIEACLRAKFILKKDTDYIIQNKQIVIIDEHTGRAMAGRRWSNGHHQAVEAKEKVPIQEENQTLASITFQNYFRLYSKLSGMTGTADTEAQELEEIYNLQVLVMPRNKKCIRKDENDIIYMSQKEKYDAIIKDILARHAKKQPILIGTTSIESSEYLSSLLNKKNIAHRVLNAKNHAQEADIIAQAGEPGKVTIATNMAGRGTDIVLGGNPESLLEKAKNQQAKDKIKNQWKERNQQVLEAGGLHVLGSERHESRRVDNQLKGRCSRQGDPGSCQFFLSLEDHLFRIFPKGILSFIQNSSKNKGESLQAPMLNQAIASNQKKMESHYFDIRKQLLKYDDIANEQRLTFYEQRNELLKLESIQDSIQDMFLYACKNTIEQCKTDEQNLDKESLKQQLSTTFNLLPDTKLIEKNKDNLAYEIASFYYHLYQEKIKDLPQPQYSLFEKNLLLQIMDHHWKEHLLIMEDLRESIGFRGYAQRNPEHEYKMESFNIFNNMLQRINIDFTSKLSKLEIQENKEDNNKQSRNKQSKMTTQIATPFD